MHNEAVVTLVNITVALSGSCNFSIFLKKKKKKKIIRRIIILCTLKREREREKCFI